MKDEQEKRSAPGNDEQPVIENEAIKNSDQVAEDKVNKELTTSEDLPGYPHYAPEEDVLNPSSELERADVDVETITRSGKISGDLLKSPSIHEDDRMEIPVPDDLDDDQDLEIVPGTEADVTKEDLLLLGPRDQDMDLGEDEALRDKGFPLTTTGDDLDVPGEELDDPNEELGEEDEENNYYSLGGDNHDNLEDPQ